MIGASTPARATEESSGLADRYRRIRGRTLALCETLGPGDMVVQSMPDASPAK